MSNYESMNPEQQKAVETTEGPVLILAGAGSGKTRVLVHRIAHMIDDNGVNPYNIMAITFTNKAAGEMRDRVDKLVGYGSENIWVMTFHATCVRILRRFIDRLGYDNNFTIYDTDDQKSLMKDICKRLQIDTKMIKERSLLSAISSAKNEMISPVEYEMQNMGDYNKKRYIQAYHEYQAELKKNNALDFDDILVKAVELFKNCPDVLENYQKRFHYIMVDEYQDTNTVQFEFIRLLAERNRNLCVVGDDDQSIYKFRGANIRNILDFEKIYSDAVIIKLEQNYRSSQNILDAANTVIKNNIGRKEKALWTEQGPGERLHYREFDTAQDEAEYIADDIARKAVSDPDIYQNTAILYRTNAQSRLLEERFVRDGIPYNIVGGVNFYARKEIKDIMSYLKTIDNARDDLAVKRIINIPKRGIGATTIAKVDDYAIAHGVGFYDALRSCDQIPGIGKAALKINGFVDLIQVFRSKMNHYSLEELLKDILEQTQYIESLQENAETDDEAADRKANIDELISKVVAYEETHDDPTLNEFLEEVALVADIDNVGEDDQRVLLMTLHSAKGLEFDNVYMAGMEDGIFPSYMSTSTDNNADLEEERRLAYVGITRAKKILTLTYAKQRMIRGETQYNPVSRFVREIPKTLMDNYPTEKRRFDDYDVDDYSRKVASKNPYSVGGKSSVMDIYSMKPATGGFSRSSSVTGGSGSVSGGVGGFSRSGSAENGRMSTGGFSRTGSQTGSTNVGKTYSVGSTGTTGSAGYSHKFSSNPYGTGVGGLSKGMPGAGEKPDYEVGDRVTHIKYGVGTVMAMEKGPRDYQVTVMFDTAGSKIMYAAFAKLKKV